MKDELITAYLLEELSEAESEQFEESCFANEEWPAELESTEDDLIDAYLRGELTPDQHRRFEENYLTTVARMERLLMARSFLRVVCQEQPKQLTLMYRLHGLWERPLVPQFAIAVLVLAIVAPLLWTITRFNKSVGSYVQLNLEISSPDRREGPPVQTVKLPLGANALRISLKLPEPSSGATYRVQLENVDNVITPLTIEAQYAQSVFVTIPASSLSPGRYILKLFKTDRDGTERPVNGSYYFNVE